MPVWPQPWFLALKWFSSSCSIVDPLMAQLVEQRPIDFMNVDIPRLLVWFWLERSALVAWGFPGGSDVKESAYNAGDLGSILGSGRSPGEGNSYPFQYSCLESPMDRGAWWAIVHGGLKESDTTEWLTLWEFLYKWNHTVCRLFRLASFI